MHKGKIKKWLESSEEQVYIVKMSMREITFEEILPMWEQLWEGRQSPIEPVSSMVYLGGYDLTIKTAYEPTFLGVFDEDNPDELVAVNSGVRTSSELYRSRGLYVLESHRKRGFASWLLEEIADQAKTEGCTSIWSLPRQSAYPAYRKAGFRKTSEWIDDDGVEFGPNCYVIRSLGT